MYILAFKCRLSFTSKAKTPKCLTQAKIEYIMIVAIKREMTILKKDKAGNGKANLDKDLQEEFLKLSNGQMETVLKSMKEWIRAEKNYEVLKIMLEAHKKHKAVED